jgi:hypothetical protein
MKPKKNLYIQIMKAPVSFFPFYSKKHSFKQDEGIGLALFLASRLKRLFSILVYIAIIILLSAMFVSTFNVDNNTAGINAVIE